MATDAAALVRLGLINEPPLEPLEDLARPRLSSKVAEERPCKLVGRRAVSTGGFVG